MSWTKAALRGALLVGAVSLASLDAERVVADSPSTSKMTPSSGARLPRQEDGYALDSKAWKDLQSTFPDLRDYVLADPMQVLASLVDSVEADEERTLYDQTCHPIVQVSRNDVGQLEGSVRQSRRVKGKHKKEHWDGVIIGSDITLLCGSDLEYERQPDRTWKETQVSASGCMELGPRSLYKVTPLGLYYGEPFYALDLVVRTRHVENQECRDGTRRTCSWETYGFNPRSVTEGLALIGHGTASIQANLKNVDCTRPCPVSNHERAKAALERLRDQTFLRSLLESAEHPTIFWTLAGCRNYTSKHKISDPWTVRSH